MGVKTQAWAWALARALEPDLALQGGGLHTAGLPDGKVGVLQAHQRQTGRLNGTQLIVGVAHFVQHHLYRQAACIITNGSNCLARSPRVVSMTLSRHH